MPTWLQVNLRSRRDISSFVFQTMRHAKAANISDLHGQLTWAYNAIAPEIARDVDPSDENILIASFLERLESRKETWYRIYSRKSNFTRNNYPYQPKGYSSQFRQNPSLEENHDSYPPPQESLKPRQRLLEGPSEKSRENQGATPGWKNTSLRDFNSGGRGKRADGFAKGNDNYRPNYKGKDRERDPQDFPRRKEIQVERRTEQEVYHGEKNSSILYLCGKPKTIVRLDIMTKAKHLRD